MSFQPILIAPILGAVFAISMVLYIIVTKKIPRKGYSVIQGKQVDHTIYLSENPKLYYSMLAISILFAILIFLGCVYVLQSLQ